MIEIPPTNKTYTRNVERSRGGIYSNPSALATRAGDRDFPLEHLIVITAMVGTEWPDTATDFESHILPLLREHGVRFVQVARGGHLEEDGIVIRDDSRSPECLHIDGAYRLEEELEAAGTVPQYGSEHR